MLARIVAIDPQPVSITPQLALADDADNTSQNVDLLTERTLAGQRITVATALVATEILERVGLTPPEVADRLRHAGLHPLDRSHRCRQVITLGSRDRLNSATTGARPLMGRVRQGRLASGPDVAARGPGVAGRPGDGVWRSTGELPLTSPRVPIGGVRERLLPSPLVHDVHRELVFSEFQGVVDGHFGHGEDAVVVVGVVFGFG